MSFKPADKATYWDYKNREWVVPETRVEFVNWGIMVIAFQVLWLIFLR